MKVVKKAKKPFWTKEVQCTGAGNQSINGRKGKAPCGSTLEINANDIYITKTYSYDGSSERCFTIKCPECGCETDIPAKELPTDIRDFLRGKELARKNDNGRDT